MALKVPLSDTGTTGTCELTAMNAEPSLNGPVQPSQERVPSGNTTMLQPSASRVPGVLDSVPPRRSMGNVLNSTAEPAARHQVSKK